MTLHPTLFGFLAVTLAGGALIVLWKIDCITRRAVPLQRSPVSPPLPLPEWLIVSTLALAALAIRVWKLEDYPFFLHNDEMSCGIVARQFLLPNPPSLQGTGWLGHPHLGFYLISLFLRLFGVSLWGLRMNAVGFGLISLAAAYVLFRSMFGVRVAILTLALTVGFHFHLHFSRMGIHNMEATALSMTAVTLFYLGFHYERFLLAGLGGIVGGIALQTYSSAFLTPILCVCWGGIAAVQTKRLRPLALVAVFCTLCFFTLLPMVEYWIRYPSMFNPRARDMAVWTPRGLNHMKSAIQWERYETLIGYQLKRSFGFLFVGQDTSIQYAFSGTLMDGFTILPLIGGFVVATWRAIRSPGYLLILLIYVLTTLFGGVLLVDAPFSPRFLILSLTAPLYVALFWDKILSISPKALAPALGGIVCLTVIGSTYLNLHYYFVDYPQRMPGMPRDQWIRLAIKRPWIQRLVSTFPQEESLNYESFAFLTPTLRREWKPLPNGQNALLSLDELRMQPGPTLVVSPPPLCPATGVACTCTERHVRATDTCWFIVE